MATVLKLQNGKLFKFQNGYGALLSKGILQAGTPTVFEASDTRGQSICKLDATHFIICYGPSAGGGYARCATFDGSSFSFGDALQFESGVVGNSISVDRISDTTALVTFRDEGDGYKGKACVLTLSGTTVSAGDLVTVLSSAYYTRVCVLDSTHAIAIIDSTVISLSISGTSVSVNNSVTLEALDNTSVDLCATDSTSALAAWRATGSPRDGYCRAARLTLSGTTVSAGSPVTVYSAATTVYARGLCAMSSSKAIITYGVQDAGAYSNCITIPSMLVGDPQQIDSSGSQVSLTSGAKLTDNEAVFCYMRTSSGYPGAACLTTLSGTTVTGAAPIIFDANMGSSSNYATTKVVAIDSSKVVVVYSDVGNSRYGTACIISLV